MKEAAPPARYHFRPVRPEDDAFLWQVYESTRELERSLAPWTDEDWKAFIDHQFQAQRAYYGQAYPEAEHKILVVDDEDAGRIYVDRSGTGAIQIMDLAILPAFRGRGVGSRVLRALQKEARKAKRVLQLCVEKNNPRAFELWQSLGFAGVDDIGTHVVMRWPAPTPESPTPESPTPESE